MKDYKLLNITLCSGFVGVWYDDKIEELFSRPLTALGVAEVTERSAENGKSEYRDVVGLMLENGQFEVTQEDSNFAGIFQQGQSIEEATGYLHGDLLKSYHASRLKKAKAAEEVEATDSG